MSDQSARLDWLAGDVPLSTRFDDPYFSLESGLDETRHVFLQGNGLPARAHAGFQVAELGFGTGLNLLALVAALDESGVTGPVQFTSFEAYPLSPAEMARALAVFPELDASALLAAWGAGQRAFTLGPVRVELILGDAAQTLPAWGGRADAWFLDGFAPAKNPDLWAPPLMQSVADHTRPGGTFATYTAAGAVRRALAQAGFRVTRQPGFGRKRHMTCGVLA